MHTILQMVKVLVASVLMYTGLLRLIARRRLRDKMIILTYHRVLNKERRALCHSSDGVIVSEKTFEKNLTVLRRYIQIISLQRLIDYASGTAPIPNNSCLITFDDAWLDNYDVAFPLLRKHEVPASIFVPVGYVDRNTMFWQEELMMHLSSILKFGDEEDIRFLRDLTSCHGRLDSRTFQLFVARAKDTGYEGIEETLSKTRKQFKESFRKAHYNKYMTWEHIQEMRLNGVSFGSHAISHRRLTKISESDCEQELTDSKSELEDRLGGPICALAYPNGDHSKAVARQVSSAGYRLAFTTESGFMDKHAYLLAIPRINVHESFASNSAVFMCTVLKIF